MKVQRSKSSPWPARIEKPWRGGVGGQGGGGVGGGWWGLVGVGGGWGSSHSKPWKRGRGGFNMFCSRASKPIWLLEHTRTWLVWILMQMMSTKRLPTKNRTPFEQRPYDFCFQHLLTALPSVSNQPGVWACGPQAKPDEGRKWQLVFPGALSVRGFCPTSSWVSSTKTPNLGSIRNMNDHGMRMSGQLL